MLGDATDNYCFRQLLAFNAAELGRSWDSVDLHVHMVRIIGTPYAAGQPSPEGVHQDGFDFVSIHLIGRENAVGGETHVRSADGREIVTATLEQSLDSLYINDRTLYHTTSAVSPVEGNEAHRDVLLISYEKATFK